MGIPKEEEDILKLNKLKQLKDRNDLFVPYLLEKQ